MTIDELIEIRKQLYNPRSFNVTKIELKVVEENSKKTLHEFLDGKDLGYHYKLSPEYFKDILESYKNNTISLDNLWKELEKYFR